MKNAVQTSNITIKANAILATLSDKLVPIIPCITLKILVNEKLYPYEDGIIVTEGVVTEDTPIIFSISYATLERSSENPNIPLKKAMIAFRHQKYRKGTRKNSNP